MKKKYPLEQLFKAITLIEDEEECKLFFDDICTAQELEKMAQQHLVEFLVA